MVSRGGVAPFDGDLDDYQRYLLDEAKRQREAIKEAASGAAKAASQALKNEAAAHNADEQSKAQQRRMDGAKQDSKQGGKPAPLNAKPKSAKRELELVEARMTVLNGEGAAMEVRLADSPTPTEIAELGKRLKLVNDELQGLEEKWLSLSSEMESASA
jgi:ATP-binding cassette, subfamily F, member 3